MPKKKVTKKVSPARFVKTAIKRAVKNPAVMSALGGDGIMTVGVPAVAGLIGSRLVSYMANKLAGKGGASAARWQQALAPHAATLGSLFFLALVWYATSNVKQLKKYRTGALVGAGVATGLTIVQSYLMKPKLLAAPRQAAELPVGYDDDEDLGMEDAQDVAGDDLESFQTGIFAN